MRLYTNQTDSDEMELYAACSCNHPSHVIKVSHYPEDDELWISFIISPQTFIEKLKAIWHIMFAGGATVHEILLDEDTWPALAEKLATRAIQTKNIEGTL